MENRDEEYQMEFRCRLIEAAAKTPVVRQHLDDKKAAAAAHAMAASWYNDFINVEKPVKAQPGKAPGKSGSSKN